jgi:two-component system cell cycle response regulator
MGAKILVIEDNRANLELMSYLLRVFGHEPIPALDGQEAWEAAQREPFDLFLCDIHLPRLDGYGLAKLLKGDETLKKTPLIAVTAHALVGDRDKVYAAGFDGYISKPIDPESFIAQVDAFLPTDKRGSRPSTNAAPPRGTK